MGKLGLVCCGCDGCADIGRQTISPIVVSRGQPPFHSDHCKRPYASMHPQGARQHGTCEATQGKTQARGLASR